MSKFSVVIPTYKRPEGIRRVLNSLVGQTDKDFEVVVVEDGSKVASDVCQEFKDDLKIAYFWQENAGPAKARNLGFKKALGEVIAFTDDDMKLPQDWVAKLKMGFRTHPEVVGVGGFMKAPESVFQKSKFAQYEWFVSSVTYHADSQERVGGFESPAGGTNNIAFKKKILDEVGGFDENFPVPAGEDADLKKRITDKGYKLLYIPIQADHYQPYGLKRFIRQSFVRGVGTYYFVNKHERPLTKKVIYHRFLAIPGQFLVDISQKDTRGFAFIKLLENFNIARGLLAASQGRK